MTNWRGETTSRFLPSAAVYSHNSVPSSHTKLTLRAQRIGLSQQGWPPYRLGGILPISGSRPVCRETRSFQRFVWRFGAVAHDRAAAAGTAPTTGVPTVPCPSPRRAYAWLVGWHGRHTTQRKPSDHQRFVQTLHRIEPSIAVGEN